MFSEINNILSVLSKEHPCRSGEEIRRLVAPFAAGQANGCLRIPLPTILKGNYGVRSWCSMLSMYTASSVDYWLGEMFEFNPSKPILHALSALDPLHSRRYVLPCVFFTDIPYKVSCRSVHITELISEYNMQKVEDLLVYLWSLVALGIFLTDFMAKHVFELTDVEDFIASRLFQGKVDEILGDGRISVFMEMVNTNGNVYDSSGIMESMEKGGDMVLLIQREKQLIQSVTFLGNETPQVIAMGEAMKLSSSYQDYLQTDSSFTKVGVNIFDQIVLGAKANPSISGYPPEDVEVKYSVPSTSSVPVSSISKSSSSKFIPLFGGTSSVICDFGGASGYVSNTLNTFSSNDIRLI